MVRMCISYHTMTNLLHRYYGRFCPNCGYIKVSIDGSTPQRLNTRSSWDFERLTNESSPLGGLNQRMIWSNTSLDPGRHTVNITSDDIGNFLYLDFFR